MIDKRLMFKSANQRISWIRVLAHEKYKLPRSRFYFNTCDGIIMYAVGLLASKKKIILLNLQNFGGIFPKIRRVARGFYDRAFISLRHGIEFCGTAFCAPIIT